MQKNINYNNQCVQIKEHHNSYGNVSQCESDDDTEGEDLSFQSQELEEINQQQEQISKEQFLIERQEYFQQIINDLKSTERHINWQRPINEYDLRFRLIINYC
ncbi:hypothetical protein PPERSA_09875 [Pseudocohnilembus persalinus]|uniref:Uncharacterized protein n=1 Tax=Pseudocohnilembus persalinus TaxID=266149 RepID=A0A0V0QU64_PSEPJ|nr:hypothetical protein PPERSA_09875 [Pseudocohnilembus persalinus]|eukprot:KRX05735.1 hypothetical protein PPERSA_09875 [Pseudocohnilembus persalinus]